MHSIAERAGFQIVIFQEGAPLMAGIPGDGAPIPNTVVADVAAHTASSALFAGRGKC